MALPAVGATVTVTFTGTVLKATDAGPPKVLVQVDPPADDANAMKQTVWVTDLQVA